MRQLRKTAGQRYWLRHGCNLRLSVFFEPFFSTKPIGEGPAWALPWVHGIVEAMGGAITVVSKPGVGSSFQVYLPTYANQSPEGLVEPLEEIPRGSERILLVDDEEEVATLGQRMLSSFGYDTAIETSPFAALALFTEQPERFDLVITDQMMPRMTGSELWPADA